MKATLSYSKETYFDDSCVYVVYVDKLSLGGRKTSFVLSRNIARHGLYRDVRLTRRFGEGAGIQKWIRASSYPRPLM